MSRVLQLRFEILFVSSTRATRLAHLIILNFIILTTLLKTKTQELSHYEIFNAGYAYLTLWRRNYFFVISAHSVYKI